MTERATLPGETGRPRRHAEALAALAALPAAWAGADHGQVAESLADALVEVLDLEFVYLTAGGRETARTRRGPPDNGLLVSLRPALAPWLRPEAEPAGLLPYPTGNGPLRLARTPLGSNGTAGAVLCASRRDDFPSEEDRLVIQAAANLAAAFLDARAREEVLRQERDELADFVENATIGLHRVGPDGTILWANQAELDLLGYAREEYVGRHIADFYADPDAGREILRRLSGREELRNHPIRLRCKDGSVRHVALDSSVCWKDGRFAYTRCFTRDVTAEHRAREALAQSEGRLRDLVGALPAALYTCDAQGRITQYNRAAAELWGRQPELSKDLWCGSWRIYRPDGSPVPLDECPMADALHGGRPAREEELVIERPDGTRRNVLVSPVPIRDPSGAVTGAINLVVDITDRKGAERRLAAEHAVTRALAEARSFDQAAPSILESLRTTLGAELSALWLPDEFGRELRCAALSTGEGAAHLGAFVEQTFATPFPRGESLPGRVWQTRRSAWITDVPGDADFARAPAAAQAGLCSGVGFPILIGAEFFGVIEFYFGRPLAPDLAVFNMMAVIGSEIGQFIHRTRVEAQLARFKFITDHSVEALALLDRDGRHVYVNQTHCQLHGYSAEELLNMGALDLNTSMDLERFRQLFDASQAGAVAPYEVVHRRKDGSTFPVEIAQTGVRFGGVPYVFAAKRDITDRKRAEQALAENEERLRFTLAATRVGTWDWDMDSGRVRWSDNLEAIHGMAPGTFDGSLDGVLRDVHPEDRDAVRQAVARAVEDGGDYHVEYRLSPRDRQTRWVEGKGRVLYRDGRPWRMSGICMDVTERKQAEDALRQSERLYRGIGEALDYGIWICDADGRNVYVSQSFLDLVGLTQEQCSEFGWGSVLHPDDADATLAAWKECARAGTFWEREHRFRGIDGRWHPVLARGVPIRDERGAILCWAGLNLDISNLKRTEDQLRERTRNLEIINRFNVTLAGQLDLDRLVQDVTEAGTQLSGARFGSFFYNVEDDRGQSYMLYALAGVPREAFARFPMPRNTALFAPTFRGEGIVRLDDVTRDPRYGQNPPHHGMPEGHLPVRSYLAVPVVSRSGKVHGGLFFGHPEPGVFTEQTEQLLAGIAAQAAVALDNARLFEAAQKEIARRRRTEEELQLARAAAEAASRAKSDFLAKMSHELRTPLNAVIGMSRMLQTRRFGELTHKQADYLHDIRHAGEHLLQMINDILDLSKVEAGRLELNPAVLPVTETVGETLSPLRAIAENKGIRLAFEPPADGGAVFHDKARFNQILFNLLSNALKFTPEGGQVTVRCQWAAAVARDAEAAPRDRAAGLRIDVEDTGVGIPPEHQDVIWESFQQLKAHLPRPVEGTGLGLPLCRQLVQLMGGHIWLTSTPGRGSCFSFVLPLRQPGKG